MAAPTITGTSATSRPHFERSTIQSRPGFRRHESAAGGDCGGTAEAPAAAKDALREALAGIDPDALAPREALDALYRLKQIVADGR